MCGILGQIDLRGDAVDRATFESMLDTLSRRGPDGRGSHFRENVALGHTRLAIRDLRLGQQPWLSPNQDVALTYNGEIYNDAELRRGLEQGFDFHSSCDTEVLLAAYLEWGIDCVSKLNGMFAFGLYDFRKRELRLVRDRFGVKPLYFAQVGEQFIFSSTIAAIVNHPLFSKSPNWSVLSHYLSTTRLTLGNQTIYDGIYQLQPSEHLLLKKGKVLIEKYWDYPTEVIDQPYEDSVAQLEDSLTNSIRMRLKTDASLGIFLSGGVDSSTIAAIARNEGCESIFATCGESSHQASDEGTDGSFARMCSQEMRFNFEPTCVTSRRYFIDWDELISDFRTPLSTPSDVVIYNIAKTAKQHVKTVLGGEGADELLCGYEVAHWSGYEYDALLNSDHQCNREFVQSIESQYGRTCFANEADHYFSLNSLIQSSQKKLMLNEEVFDSISHDFDVASYYQSQYDEMPFGSTQRKHTQMLHRVNLESLLSRLDSTTMHAGLEARVPFTDHQLVERMMQIPLAHRIQKSKDAGEHSSLQLHIKKQLNSKRVLRTLANRLLPNQLANRPKASFPTGVEQWIQSDWIRWAQSKLENSPFARFLFRDSFIGEISSLQFAGPKMFLWPILNLAIWGDREFF